MLAAGYPALSFSRHQVAYKQQLFDADRDVAEAIQKTGFAVYANSLTVEPLIILYVLRRAQSHGRAAGRFPARAAASDTPGTFYSTQCNALGGRLGLNIRPRRRFDENIHNSASHAKQNKTKGK